jgi:hypothetical protein
VIVVKIEMWPGGFEARKREIGRVNITNVGGSSDVGHYKVEIPKSTEYAKRPGIWKRGEVRDFPRLSLGPADLLLRALLACVGTRSPNSVLAALDNDPDVGDAPNAEATS